MKFFQAYRGIRRLDRSQNLDLYRDVRDRRLQEILTAASAQVPLYKGRLPVDIADFNLVRPIDKSRLTRDVLASLNQKILSDLEVTPAAIIDFREQVNPANLWISEKINVAQTSGTSGQPVEIFRTRSELTLERALEMARQNQPGRPWREYLRMGGFRLASLLHDSPTSAAKQRFHNLQSRLRPFAKFLILSIYDDVQENHRKLSEFAPHQLVSYPVPLAALAKSKLAGIYPGPDPAVITSGADLLVAADRRLLTEAFPSAMIREHYGAVECSSMALSCQHGNLHLNEDYCILEVMNDGGDPVAVGEWGDHILVTSLVRQLQPIIRYRIEDRVRFTGAPCTCGSPLAVIEINGRRFPDFVVLDDEDLPLKLSAYQFRKSLGAPWIHRYQVVQIGKRSFEIRIVANEPSAQLATELVQLEKELRHTLEKIGPLDKVYLEFSKIEAEEFLRQGPKVKQFITLKPSL